MSSPTNKNLARGGTVATSLVLLVCAATLGFVAANRQGISDWIRLRGYTPPPAVLSLASQDGMNGYARHLFYLNRPRIISTVSSFRQECPESENTIVLGCYHPGENGIGIYKVQDAKLSGVEQVTAAHEVLHAAYDRLSDTDRRSLDRQLKDFYDHGLTDQRVKDEIRIYQKTEPNDVLNEMHSIFGTEVAKLPPGLESHYLRYFKDRQTVVAYGQRYQSEFSRRQAVIKRYDDQLAGLKTQIDSAESILKSKLAALDAKQSELNAERNGDPDAYNADVAVYNRLVDEYNAGIASTKILVSQYNRIVSLRNQVAGELADLAKALDTRRTPKAAQ